MEAIIPCNTMKTKRILRLIAFAFFISLACILPVPISFSRKDDAPKYLIEQIDSTEKEDEDESVKALF